MKNIITAALFAAASTFTATTASAFTAGECSSIANATRAMAEARDAGVPLSEIQGQALESFRNSNAMAIMFVALADVVYNSKTLTPDVLKDLTLQTCLDQWSTDS